MHPSTPVTETDILDSKYSMAATVVSSRRATVRLQCDGEQTTPTNPIGFVLVGISDKVFKDQDDAPVLS